MKFTVKYGTITFDVAPNEARDLGAVNLVITQNDPAILARTGLKCPFAGTVSAIIAYELGTALMGAALASGLRPPPIQNAAFWEGCLDSHLMGCPQCRMQPRNLCDVGRGYAAKAAGPDSAERWPKEVAAADQHLAAKVPYSDRGIDALEAKVRKEIVALESGRVCGENAATGSCTCKGYLAMTGTAAPGRLVAAACVRHQEWEATQTKARAMSKQTPLEVFWDRVMGTTPVALDERRCALIQQLLNALELVYGRKNHMLAAEAASNAIAAAEVAGFKPHPRVVAEGVLP